MGAAASYPKRELRRLRYAWLRRNRRLVALIITTLGVSVALTSWSAARLDTSVTWYAVGVLHAAVAAAFLHLLNTAVLAHEPRAIHQLRGSWGEDNTRSELDSARRKKLVWGWVDSITLKVGDLDHVVVTRNGGVVVLDSKFHTAVTGDGIAAMTASAARARTRAEGLARSLLKAEAHGRRRASRTSVSVTPCIVLWGPARHGVPDGYHVDGVHFVDGTRLIEWLRQLPHSPVSKDAAQEFLGKLEDFRTQMTADVRQAPDPRAASRSSGRS